MVALVLKKKPALAPAITPAVKSELELQLDLVGSHQAEVAKLKKQIKELQAKLKPYDEEIEKLQQLVDALEIDDDETDQISGDRFRAEIGPKGKSRSIKDLGKAKEHLGDELFMQLATVTLKNLDAYLTPPQLEDVIETSRTKRSIKIEKK